MIVEAHGGVSSDPVQKPVIRHASIFFTELVRIHIYSGLSFFLAVRYILAG